MLRKFLREKKDEQCLVEDTKSQIELRALRAAPDFMGGEVGLGTLGWGHVCGGAVSTLAMASKRRLY